MPLNVEAWGLISGIKYLDEDNSIINALKLSEFDAFLHLCERDRSVGSSDGKSHCVSRRSTSASAAFL